MLECSGEECASVTASKTLVNEGGTHASQLGSHGAVNQLIADTEFQPTNHGWICVEVQHGLLAE
jgi:hypothetical protein